MVTKVRETGEKRCSDFRRWEETSTHGKRERKMLRMQGQGTNGKIQTERVAE